MHRAERRLKQNDRQGHLDVPGVSLSRAVLTLLLLLGIWVMPVAGQAAANLAISSPQTGAFPEISVEFKLTDSTGHPIRELDPSQLTIIENENELPVTSISEIYRGIHFVLVINGDREMDLRDASGISRYQKMTDVLQSWVAGRHFSGDDSWSLMTNEGLGVGDASNAVTWMTALDVYQPNLRQLEPDLTSLQEAIQMLQRADAAFGVDKALLYLTPPPTPDQIAGVNTLAEQSRQAGIQVNVWMVGEAYYLTNDQGGSLIEMAASTGGQFFHYSGVETLPDLTGTLSDLGYASELTYESGLRATGSYPLVIRAALSDLEITGESLPFYITIQPPNPMLLAPPASISREAVAGEGSDTASFSPSQVDLQILVEYPDGHPRELTASRLLVDGSVVDVNVSAPFDVFSWDISGLTETGEHTIQVEVEDSLGLRAATLLTPVQIEIIEPGLYGQLSLQQIGLVVSGIIAGAGLVLLGVWLFRKFWRVNQPWWQNRRQAALSGKGKSASEEMDGEEQRYALLLPLDSFNEPGEGNGLAVNQPRVLIGNDPQQVDLVLSSPGVDPIQAELSLEEDGFWLRHLGSPSRSTWLNYQPIGTEPVRVKPGDLLHFGELGFRFTMEVNEPDKKISISRYEPFS
jgi:hypothetical protein